MFNCILAYKRRFSLSVLQLDLIQYLVMHHLHQNPFECFCSLGFHFNVQKWHMLVCKLHLTPSNAEIKNDGAMPNPAPCLHHIYTQGQLFFSLSLSFLMVQELPRNHMQEVYARMMEPCLNPPQYIFMAYKHRDSFPFSFLINGTGASW